MVIQTSADGKSWTNAATVKSDGQPHNGEWTLPETNFVKVLFSGNNTYLYLDDVSLVYRDWAYKALEKFTKICMSGGGDSMDFAKLKEPKLEKSGKIVETLKQGQVILVQVSKEAISTKGPRLCTEISFAGRYLVLVPFSEKVSVSQKIKSAEERNRLRKLIKSIKPDNFGIIIRTIAEGKSVAELDADLKDLLSKWESVKKKLPKALPPTKLVSELDKSSVILRDMLTEEFSNVYVTQLKRNRSKYQKDLAAKKKQVEALNREIERIIAASMRGKGTGKIKQPVDMKLDSEFSKNKGRLPWPADGPVVDHFGQHYHPVFKSVKLPFNNGVNIALPKDAPVKAVFDGVVKQIVVMPGYNKCVLVQHGNYFSFYCKLGSTAVKPGDKVKTGQIVGTVDTIDGMNQLHFQIWKGTTPQNPELWLR